MFLFNNFQLLFTGFMFLRLQSRNLSTFQWWFPTVISGFCICLSILKSGFAPNIDSSVIDSIINVVGVLIGFYLASLAAIFSFGQKLLDAEMGNDSPIIPAQIGIRPTALKATRRRFLCYLFGYLAIASVTVLLLSVIIRVMGVEASIAGKFSLLNVIPIVLVYLVQFVYFWFIGSILIVTLLGLHYLVDRMHRS